MNEQEYVIGLDFGNFYSQPCIITGIDPETRRGGTFRDLTDPSSNIPYGIPTAFFYARNKFNGQTVCGNQAVKAVPPANCIRYLKRDMFKDSRPNSITIDGRTFTYDEMIVAAAQYALRVAADQLQKQWNITTNKVALAYPASIGANAKNHLVELIEQVTLEDGRKVQVVGTIAEPAAAALDYLAQDNTQQERTVLVYDFGAGTFDVSIVSAYPNGRVRADGTKYYYDVKYTDGYANLGGAEIDKVMIQLLQERAGEDAKDPRTAQLIRIAAEGIKRDLSTAEKVQPQIILVNGFMDEISRTEFEKRIEHLINKTVDMVDDAMKKNSDLKIDMIVLTGGSSQMPIVKRMLEQRFPAYREKIRFHQPSKAISAGAARFGVIEPNPDPIFGDPGQRDKAVINAVVVRTIRDIGIRFYNDEKDEKGYITVYVPSGTPIPFTSEYITSTKLGASRFSRFSVYEAVNSSPDINQPERDFTVVCDIRHDHGCERPKGYESKTRIMIDEKHLTNLEVVNRSMPPRMYPFSVEHLLK